MKLKVGRIRVSNPVAGSRVPRRASPPPAPAKGQEDIRVHEVRKEAREPHTLLLPRVRTTSRIFF